MSKNPIKTPLRNACLRLRNRFANGNEITEVLDRYKIDLVLDVGANVGQYARNLIRNGYRGRIVSFEPLPTALPKLQESRWGFDSWEVKPFALGSENSTATLNIAGNSMSSSLRGMLPSHVEAAPESAYVDECVVEVKRMDSVIDKIKNNDERCYLKIDVQGHEHHVIDGAMGCLDSITGIQMELSLQLLYEGQMVWQQAIDALESKGFQLMKICPGFCDRRTGAMLQADGIFIRKEAVNELKMAA